MASSVVIQDSFLASAYQLPKEITKKVMKALHFLAAGYDGTGLNIEKLSGTVQPLWSARVDEDYRIIFRRPKGESPVLLFVGKHDVAYGYAERRPSLLPGVGLYCVGTSLAGSIAGALPSTMLKRERKSTVSLPNLERMVTTRKYVPLAQKLLNQASNELTLTFKEIESILGDSLPESARNYRAWWSNESSGRHVQASAWVGIGFRVAMVSLGEEVVRFSR